MKKWVKGAIAALAITTLVACGKDDTKKEDANAGTTTPKTEEVKKLVVGATNVPHAEVLEEAKPLLKEKGIDLEIKVFNDYVLPNKTLASKELDANYFQHIPYFEQQLKDNKDYQFTNAGGVHIEPIGLYSSKYKKVEDLPDGAEIIMSNSVADHGRALSMLQEKGLIKLKDGVNKTTATEKDIVDNPKHLKFKTDIEPSFLPQAYKNNEGDAVLINANFALDAGLDPSKDPIAVESPKDNPYVNIVAVRTGDESRPEIKTLIEVLHSQKIKDFINTKYKGAVIPAE